MTTAQQIDQNQSTKFSVRASDLVDTLRKAIRAAADSRRGRGAVVRHGGDVANAYAYPADTEITGAVAVRTHGRGGVAYGRTGRMPANKATQSGAAARLLACRAPWDTRYTQASIDHAWQCMGAACRKLGDVTWHEADTGAIAFRAGSLTYYARRHTTRDGQGLRLLSQSEWTPVRLARVMRRLCPSGWIVVSTPPSAGAPPIPAYREVSTGEEYHATAPSNTTRSLVATAEQAFGMRANQREIGALDAILATPVGQSAMVCARDSQRAGNCDAGTRSFAVRHHLDIRRHYTAAELLQQANGDARYVRAAVLAAIRRERHEMSAGECLIADHS